MTKSTVASSGPVKGLDVASVRLGMSHAEVQQQLAPIEVDCGTARVFWGRWWASRFGVIYGELLSHSGSGGGTRLGHVHNVVYEFDEQGKLTQLFSPKEDTLVPALELSLRNSGLPLLKLDEPISLSATHWKHVNDKRNAGSLTLTRDRLTFAEPAGGHSFSVPSAAVRLLSSGLQFESSTNRIAVTIHFSQTTPAGRDVKFAIYTTELPLLLRWFQAIQAS